MISRTLQEELEQRRHHDNLLPSGKKNIGKVLLLVLHKNKFDIHKKSKIPFGAANYLSKAPCQVHYNNCDENGRTPNKMHR